MEHYGFSYFARFITPILPIAGLDLKSYIYRPEFIEFSRPTTGQRVTIKLNWPTPPKGNGHRVILVAKGEPPPKI